MQQEMKDGSNYIWNEILWNICKKNDLIFAIKIG